MFKFKLFILSVAVAALCASCNKEESSVSNEPQEITFSLGGDGMDFNVDTKATAVTSLSSVYWEAASTSGVVHAVSSYTVSTSNNVSTGKYWSSTDATYSYKASNVSFATSTGVIEASNGTDIVAGTATGVTKSTTCTITLDHIFCRTGTLTLNTQEGYTLGSTITWKIASSGADSGTAGTYTIGSGWGSSATTPLSSTEFTSSSDLYLIPATYTVTVTYTLIKGNYSKEFTKSGNVTLDQGKVNNISATAVGGDASQIIFSVSLTDWGSADKTVTFS